MTIFATLRRLALAAGLLLSAPAAAEDTPALILRDLNALHRALLAGYRDAARDLQARMAAFDARFAGLPAEARASRAGVEAALIHVLSGGAAASLRAIQAGAADKDFPPALLRAVATAREGRSGEAVAPLAAVDPAGFPPLLAGHLAMARARLTPEQDTAGLLSMLDRARLLAPGTIVEETALRRQALAAARLGDGGRFASLASRYFRRFGASVYAEEFRGGVAAAIVALTAKADDETLARLGAMLASLPVADRRDFALRIARAGAARGRPSVARLARAALSRDGDPADRMRVDFYEAVAGLFGGDPEAAKTIAAIDPLKIPVDDAALRAAALALAAGVRAWPAPRSAATPLSRDEAPAPVSPIAEAARAALRDADALLGEPGTKP